MALLNPPMHRTTFFSSDADTKADIERARLATRLELANRFVYLSGELEIVDKKLQMHFLPLIEATLAGEGVEAAKEFLQQIPHESLAYIQALTLICDWQKRIPS